MIAGRIIAAASISTIAVAAAFVMARYGGTIEWTSQPSVPTVPTVSASNACAMAKRFVTERLKAPATAEFPSCREAVITPQANGAAGQQYTVSSYVDSQNSFGAKLRTHYVAVVRFDGQNPSTQDYAFSLIGLTTDP